MADTDERKLLEEILKVLKSIDQKLSKSGDDSKGADKTAKEEKSEYNLELAKAFTRRILAVLYNNNKSLEINKLKEALKVNENNTKEFENALTYLQKIGKITVENNVVKISKGSKSDRVKKAFKK